MGQTFQKLLVHRNGDEQLRYMRILLRDLIRNSRADFDAHQFTVELINEQFIRDVFKSTTASAAGNGFGHQHHHHHHHELCDFAGQSGTRERYVHSVCDLITVCVLVSITPQVKDAYQRMGRCADVLPEAAKECLIKYYMVMSQIQADSVAWLQETVSRNYEINPSELIKCLFKVFITQFFLLF